MFVCVYICADPLCAHTPVCRGGWASNQIFKNGGALTGPQLLEEGCWERGEVTFFTGGGNFHIKNKLKSGIFNEKKSLYAKIVFSVIIKNSNWEIWSKNLVTFKR